MSFENPFNSPALRFFKKYIDSSENLSKIIDRKTEVNKYYLESNSFKIYKNEKIL